MNGMVNYNLSSKNYCFMVDVSSFTSTSFIKSFFRESNAWLRFEGHGTENRHGRVCPNSPRVEYYVV